MAGTFSPELIFGPWSSGMYSESPTTSYRTLLYSGASLILDFLTTQALDPRISFSRGSLATQFDASGKLTYCPNNLLLNSGNLAAASWSYSSAATATTNTVTLSGSASYYGQPVVVPSGANGIIAAVLSGSGSVVLRDANSVAKVVINLTATPTLYYFTETFGSTTAYLTLDNRTVYGADGLPKTITIGGTFMSVVTYETAPRPQDQVATGASAYFGPRFDYDPVTVGQPLGLLIEPVVTNLCTYSRDFSKWTTNGSPVGVSTANIGLDGTTGVYSWTGGGSGYYKSITVTPSTTYTMSFDVLAVSGSGTVQIGSDGAQWGTGTQQAHVFFDPVAKTFSGVAAGVTEYSYEPAPNGYLRVKITATTGPSSTAVSLVAYGGLAVRAIDNAQLEVGAKATSRIPTNGAAVTRNADVAPMPTAGWLNGNQGTFVVEVDSSAIGSNYVGLFQVDNGASTDCIYAYVDQTTSKPSTQIKVGGAQTGGSGATSNTMTAGAVAKAAFTYSPSAATACLNGGAVSSGSVSALPVMTRLQLGNGDNALMGHIRSIKYYPRTITDAELQSLTA